MKQATDSGFNERLWELHKEREKSEKRRITQGEIADEVKVRLGKRPDPSTVGDWFRGATPPLATIGALAHFYRVTRGWLAFGDEPREMASPHDEQEKASPPKRKRRRQTKP